MEFPIYKTRPADAPPALLAALGIEAIKNSVYNEKTKILLLEIGRPEELANLDPDFIALLRSHNSINGVLVTAPSAGDGYDFHSRYFWPWSGVQLKDAYYFPKDHASAENFQGYRWAGRRDLLESKLMERTWTPDQAFPICGLKLLSDRRFVLNESTLSWWDPDSVRNYRSAEARLPDAEYLFILLDLDRDEAITIYLHGARLNRTLRANGQIIAGINKTRERYV